jgi:hypothetical protein
MASMKRLQWYAFEVHPCSNFDSRWQSDGLVEPVPTVVRPELQAVHERVAAGPPDE